MGSMQDGIQERVMKLVQEQYRETAFFQPDLVITAETAIRSDLGFDSLTLTVLQIQMEDAFHIRFDPVQEDLRSVFSTVGTLCAAVQEHTEMSRQAELSRHTETAQ